jgi:hypothetical protein
MSCQHDASECSSFKGSVLIMKRINGLKVIILLVCFAVLALQTVQAKDVPEELKNESVNIKDIVQDLDSYEGKDVVIQGKIQTECPAGCWFIVEDGAASIYIDIFPSNFVIPQEAGSNVRVFGTVTKKDGDPMIVGKIVEIDGEIFR